MSSTKAEYATWGKRMKELRLASALTHGALAAKAGFEPKMIWFYEAGRSRMSRERYNRICKVLPGLSSEENIPVYPGKPRGRSTTKALVVRKVTRSLPRLGRLPKQNKSVNLKKVQVSCLFATFLIGLLVDEPDTCSTFIKVLKQAKQEALPVSTILDMLTASAP